jgi:methoxymalonate biosynthesis acyl carrier protein
MESTATIAKIRTFLERYFPSAELKNDEDFFALGLVNSLFAMQLVLFVEKESGIALDNEELNIENFNSIDAIAKLINQKTASTTKHDLP